ncbi:MAG: hypothetical protein HFH82_01400 [Lachnospiraceae bacterium]|nr:hypothetical protein [Lachnospiraceae bacterium]
MKNSIHTFIKNYLKCGLIGWCMEIIFTALDALRRRDMTLMGNTSLWMFPIYGCAAIFTPISRLLSKKSIWVRGLTYMGLIFSAEYASGQLLTKHKLCPWDYGRSPWNIHRVIRLDFAPFWFCAGLLFEHLICPERNSSASVSSAHDKPATRTLRP